MPWKETCAMDERYRFIREWMTYEGSLRGLCEEYEVSRKTAYKWIERFEQSGIAGLEEWSRARHHHPNATGEEIQRLIVDYRREHRHWGPRKLLQRLKLMHPDKVWPAASTVGAILKKHGLVEPRRFRRRIPVDETAWTRVESPNDVWATDFKGWFRTEDGHRVDPLTISDLASRYLICCEVVGRMNGAEVKGWFQRAFQEHGLPRTIRSDNGAPFASVGVGGLSRPSVWWIRLGIRPERIRPGHPEENGSHERMHRTLKQETACPPEKTLRAQQAAFDSFRREFNTERPHEALDMQTPQALYHASPRPFPKYLPELNYPLDMAVRRVRHSGEVKWGGEIYFLSESLVGEPVGFKPVDDKTWTIHFGPICLATLNAEKKGIQKMTTITTQEKVLPMCPV